MFFLTQRKSWCGSFNYKARKFITIHLGKKDDRSYDYVIDPGTKSVNDVLKFLGTIMSDAG